MPKRAFVNVAMPLEFTLFTPTYRAGRDDRHRQSAVGQTVIHGSEGQLRYPPRNGGS